MPSPARTRGPDAWSASFWLAKSEPDAYSIDDLARDKRTFWGGVRNYAARNNLQAMRKGDLAFFYHSNAEPSGVAGVMKVASEAKPDPTQFDPKDEMHHDPKATRDAPRWFGVEFALVKRFPAVIPLARIKKEPKLKEMQLLKLSRLSVTRVTRKEWDAVLALAEAT